MREDVCRHFNGVQHDECDKKIKYESFSDGEDFGITKKIPCFKKNGIGGCDFFDCPTDKEVVAHKEQAKQNMADMMAAIAIIREKTGAEPDFNPVLGKKEGRRGTIECPRCKGDLYYSVAPGNNHIWGKCSTDGCLSWMM